MPGIARICCLTLILAQSCYAQAPVSDEVTFQECRMLHELDAGKTTKGMSVAEYCERLKDVNSHVPAFIHVYSGERFGVPLNSVTSKNIWRNFPAILQGLPFEMSINFSSSRYVHDIDFIDLNKGPRITNCTGNGRCFLAYYDHGKEGGCIKVSAHPHEYRIVGVKQLFHPNAPEELILHEKMKIETGIDLFRNFNMKFTSADLDLDAVAERGLAITFYAIKTKKLTQAFIDLKKLPKCHVDTSDYEFRLITSRIKDNDLEREHYLVETITVDKRWNGKIADKVRALKGLDEQDKKACIAASNYAVLKIDMYNDNYDPVTQGITLQATPKGILVSTDASISGENPRYARVFFAEQEFEEETLVLKKQD